MPGRGLPAQAVLRLRGRDLVWGARTYVMAVINATPDSFSGDGLDRDVRAAVDKGLQAVASGADIVDVGGESTRPGSEPVGADQEIDRVVPVIRALRCRSAVPISVDTSKAAVADAALAAGADMVNDVWGLRADPDLAALVARRGVPVVLMHNRSDTAAARLQPGIGGHFPLVHYDDLVTDVVCELQASAAIALEAGLAAELLMIDPGLGFGKSADQNLQLLDEIGRLRALGYPVVVGPSRKSFIGLTLGVPPDDRLEGTAASVAVAIARGADVVRVHDVGPMVRVARMTDAIVRRHPISAPASGTRRVAGQALAYRVDSPEGL